MDNIRACDRSHLWGTDLRKPETDGPVKDVHANEYEGGEGKKVKYGVVKISFHGPFNPIRRLP